MHGNPLRVDHRFVSVNRNSHVLITLVPWLTRWQLNENVPGETPQGFPYHNNYRRWNTRGLKNEIKILTKYIAWGKILVSSNLRSNLKENNGRNLRKSFNILKVRSLSLSRWGETYRKRNEHKTYPSREKGGETAGELSIERHRQHAALSRCPIFAVISTHCQ